ncbi:beta-N-acetylhexosaminidase [Loktanella sp. Alg231-35]|uniref:beta-N-acetylhexosaminidase n=1 Tax=Loktanella sp. Alg231-35 TaxID=1922220 RepID=UPI000D557398|nr:family 20 glycosylhydrolase [Loktanella sp. Alg231-35]
MQYTCRIVGMEMLCAITPDRDLHLPVLCCSGMAPLEPVSGGDSIRSLGSYVEIALPDLKAGQVHEVVIKYSGGFKPANRAWMPLGPYLRCDKEVISLPPTPAGRHLASKAKPVAVEGLALVPQPTSWIPSGGSLAADGFSSDDPALATVADLADRQGMAFRGSHRVTTVAADLPEDAYEIDISDDGVRIAAGSYGGRFYAGITLLTLLQHGPLPKGCITDAPRFDWRGQHLDTARHFYQMPTILLLLDLMAMLKLNRFHWHFADDEAFRLEITSVPELWQKTALRGEGQTLPGMFNGQPVEGGSYSKEDARQVIAHAKALNIEVMPEIEAPAHALAITTIFPETRDPADNGAEQSVQGYRGNALNPAQPKTWKILEAVTREVGDLFPFNHLHLGCDELPEDTWMGSPMARALMAEHGLETTKDLQSWTISRLAAIAQANGQRPAAWEEAAQGAGGGIGHDAILFSWTGQGPGLDAARAGYDVVMTPAQHVYMDMAHTDDPDDWGASWAAFVDTADTVNWDPVPDPALADRIIGVQGAFWSEFTTQDEQLWPMLMPRILGVSAMAWQEQPPAQDHFLDLTTHYGLDQQGRMWLG